MKITCRVATVVGALAIGSASMFGSAFAQEAFPSKPITLVVPYAPGGGTDVTTRALAMAAEKQLGQPVTVVNQAAGGGAVGMQEVAKAAPDGYTLINFTAIQAAIAPHMREVPFDPLTEFQPIMNYGAFNTFIAVPSDSPYQTLDDLIAYAKDNPRVSTVAISVIGASSHLGMARIASDRDIEVTFVPFGGGAPAITALLGRHVTAAVTSGEILPYVKTGDVRLLATLMGERAEGYPDVPSVSEIGFDWSLNSWLGIAGPVGMPEDVVNTLQDAFVEATKDEAFIRTMGDLAVAVEVADATEAEEVLARDYEAFQALIQELKLGRYAE